jgi:DNA-binding GntR family transcriptional regulator
MFRFKLVNKISRGASLENPMQLVRAVAPLRQQVCGMLRSAIADGRFLPGQRLIERELCEALAISRPLLREALRQIEAEGLIRHVAPRGLEVVTLSIDDARHIYELRLALEGLAAAGFVRHADQAQRRELDAAMAAIDEATLENAPPRMRLAKNRFYEIVVQNCGNPMLATFLSSLHNRIQLLRGISLSEPNRLLDTVKELRAIHAAIRANDGPLAQRRCDEHIASAARVTMQALERQQALDPEQRAGKGTANFAIGQTEFFQQ